MASELVVERARNPDRAIYLWADLRQVERLVTQALHPRFELLWDGLHDAFEHARVNVEWQLRGETFHRIGQVVLTRRVEPHRHPEHRLPHNHQLRSIRPTTCKADKVDRLDSHSDGGRAVPIPILSLFTGAGFLDIGFHEAGFRAVWHNEIDPWFIEAFQSGMGRLLSDSVENTIQNSSSIVGVSASQMLDEAFGGDVPRLFGMIGGPPCPDFSVAGKNRGGDGDVGVLSLIYVERILSVKPTFFLFENVPGLIRNRKHRVFLWGLQDMLDRDYAVETRVINALDHGVPQDRERLFMIGFRRDAAVIGDFPWPFDERYDRAKSRFGWPTTNPFGANPTKPEGIPDELMVGPLICDPEVANLPNGREGFQPYSDKFGAIAEGDVSRKSFKRLHRWRYSPAAAYGNNEVHLHPTQPRRLTVREAMRIQCVPDGYVLPTDMPLSYKFKTIGNGVPVSLARAVARSIVDVIDDNALR